MSQFKSLYLRSKQQQIWSLVPFKKLLIWLLNRLQISLMSFQSSFYFRSDLFTALLCFIDQMMMWSMIHDNGHVKHHLYWFSSTETLWKHILYTADTVDEKCTQFLIMTENSSPFSSHKIRPMCLSCRHDIISLSILCELFYQETRVNVSVSSSACASQTV